MHDILSAESIFVSTLESLMNTYHINYDTCSKEAVDYTIRLCTAEFNSIWDEFMMYVIHGDDKKIKTKMLLKKIIKNKINRFN